MSMRCEVIINYYFILVHIMEVENVILLSIHGLILRYNKVPPDIASSQKSTELTTKLICTMLIQNIEHSYTVFLREYANFARYFFLMRQAKQNK